MTRLTNTLLRSGSLIRSDNQPAMVDPRNNGLAGGYPDYQSIISNTAYISRDLVAVLQREPTFFQQYEDAAALTAMLKACVEIHWDWDGLNATLTVDSDERQVVKSGNMIQTPSNVTRAPSVPVSTSYERPGRPFSRLIEFMIRAGIRDERNARASAMLSGDVGDQLMDFYSMNVLFFEPDPTGLKVEKAWLCTNMYPKAGPDHTARKAVADGGAALDFSVEWNCFDMVNDNVTAMAQAYLDSLKANYFDPMLLQPSDTEMTAAVKASDVGYAEAIAAANAASGA